MPIKKPDEYPTALLNDARYVKPYKTEVKPADRWGGVKAIPLDVYRTDPKTGKPESLPHKYDLGNSDNPYDLKTYGNTSDNNPRRQSIDLAMFHAVHDAMKLNPNLKVTPQELVAILAQEGRSDFGGNDLQFEKIKHNKDAVAMYNNLVKQGYDEISALFPALLLEKQRRAGVEGVPWQHAWNGMGKVAWTGKTGADYANEVGMNAKNVGTNDAAVNAFAAQMQEPKEAATLKDINMTEWAKRQIAIQNKKAELIALGVSEERVNREYPDAPIPFHGDPNAAIYEKASGGAIELPNNYRAGGRTRMI